jgi:putative RNA 2'-phosphotransferase
MNPQQKIDQFAKLSAYMLGRHPDEFGLVLNADGYIKIKDFLKAVNEIDGWRHIRQHHINEILLIIPNPPFEVDQSIIRARDRGFLPRPAYNEMPPKFLYTCIRHQSYPAVAEKGIHPSFHSQVICTINQELSEKIGNRRDHQPVLLTIHTKKATDRGIKFHQYGELIYLSDFIPADCFTGPPLPKESIKEKTVNPFEVYKRHTHAGSFELAFQQVDSKIKGNKKEISWKKDKKRLRKEKKQFWSE